MKNGGTILRVLVVDDEPMIRNGISRYLEGRAEIKTAASAEEALKEIVACQYDLCLLDVILPGMNGMDAMKKINELSPNTKVAIMTGSYLNEAMKEQIKDEAYDFIEKPFKLSRISEVLNKVIMATGNHHR